MEKADGATFLVPFYPSKIMINKLKLDDKWRKEILERKATFTSIPREEYKKRSTVHRLMF